MATNTITIKENRSVTVPTTHDSFAMDRREWNRLKAAVNGCKTNGQWFMSVAFCFFGISGSAFITWISLFSQTGIDNIKLVLLIGAIASFIVGILCVCFQYLQNKNQTSSIESIKSEISYIEEGIQPEAS
jgi:hypothetical protein